ncbi:organic cation transporter protein-like [Mytilus galloprovincialis]|uniref:organic cation transporter protein-like n=1 Tax=Mytilus galloprovincialis TaxID=29158 RepID=UPI003F7BB826
MKFDDILTQIGAFGPYQKRNYIPLLIGWTLTGPFITLSVFVSGVPDHRCRIPGYENDTYAIQGPEHQRLVDEFIPPSTNDNQVYDQCHVYKVNQSNTVYDNCSHPINATISTCRSWVYSKLVFDDTFVMKENLVCENKYKVSLSKTIFFAGILLGSIVFGVISDALGRKKTVLVSVLLMFSSGMSLAWSINYLMFVILRFCNGMSTVGVFITVYVLAMKWVGPSKRTFAGLMMGFLGTVGTLIFILVSYYVRRWNLIIIAFAAPVGVFLALCWFIPESPRWLCGKGRKKEAAALLQHAAFINGTEFIEKHMEEIPLEKKEAGKPWLLFSNRTLGCRTVVIFYNWMVVSMVFFGLSLNTGILYGNYYINFLLATFMEFPGSALPIFMIDRIGRKKSYIIYMTVGGFSCLSTIFTVNYGGKELQYLTTALALVGKLFSTAAFATIYVISAEVFPTAIRNTGMGLSSCWARVGGMISPFIADTAGLIGGTTGTAIPLVIFGGSCLVAAGMTLLLPETLNQHLPESIEDGKNFGKELNKKIQEEIIVKTEETLTQ